MTTTTISIEIDDERLDRVPDAKLALYWHVAQANPAPHGDPNAGALVERIGREIIRRWLATTPPELWSHQGRSYYWNELRKLAKYQPPAGVPTTSPEWHNGTWVPRDQADDNGEPDRFHDTGPADEPPAPAATTPHPREQHMDPDDDGALKEDLQLKP